MDKLSSKTPTQEEARKRFFENLTSHPISNLSPVDPESLADGWRKQLMENENMRVKRFKDILKSNQTWIYETRGKEKNRVDIWETILIEHDLAKLVFSAKTKFAPSLLEAIKRLSGNGHSISFVTTDSGGVALHDPVAKLDFLKYQAGITEVVGGLSDTGTLVVIPSIDESRALSLIPPVLIAVISQGQITADFTTWIKNQAFLSSGRSSGVNRSTVREIPSNIVLISGPSKTADIEKRLVYGVHGPKKLIVVMEC